MKIEPGTKWLFLTISYHYVGEVTAITPTEVWLKNASIVFNVGSIPEVLKTGKLREAEYAGDGVCICRQMINGYIPWKQELPK